MRCCLPLALCLMMAGGNDMDLRTEIWTMVNKYKTYFSLWKKYYEFATNMPSIDIGRLSGCMEKLNFQWREMKALYLRTEMWIMTNKYETFVSHWKMFHKSTRKMPSIDKTRLSEYTEALNSCWLEMKQIFESLERSKSSIIPIVKYCAETADVPKILSSTVTRFDASLKQRMKEAGSALLKRMEQIHFAIDLNYNRKH
ncbi:hypothetical protein D915_005622 [Fasciola hepatica]|uniref:Uncharacterized protein n=1 Tax=Fasciola hepatica TaxID=6192 RepID=A0A4E0RB77_FASHE|nr:hypothetical protein D915_005622 [Fasciola hepatica]